jgi:membrane-bound lytic murein transglycosylase A
VSSTDSLQRWRRLAAVFLGVLAIAVLSGWLWWVLRPPAPGPLRLTKASFSDLPGWRQSDPRAALQAFQRSCMVLAGRLPSAPMGGYAGTANDWHAVCAAATAKSAPQARAFFERWFTPLLVSAGSVRDAKFTGYYEPQLRGSAVEHGNFRYPVYATPSDLVSVNLGDFRKTLQGESIAGRVVGQRLVPYPSRAEIGAKGLPTARVLFYADDPVALFFLHIQGSGRVRYDDGRIMRVSYAAQNGQVYSPIGRVLIARNELSREQMSMQAIRAWLKAHPKDAPSVMDTDASYIFFREEPIGDPALGAKGAEGVALTPRASIAVDSRLHALGLPFYVATTLPDSRPFDAVVVAQDYGGAIRGPARADIFFGAGNEAETLAGGMNQTGRFYVLLPKPVAAHLDQRTDFPP